MSQENDLYIDTAESLEQFCSHLKDATWITLDTEFIRDSSYFPKLCLLQIATETQVACIDPLAINDLTALLDIIYNPNIVKVLHAGNQDMEIFYHLRGELPTPVFDTQIAASLLGYGEQVGYSKLVHSVLKIDINKAHSRTQWERRPLNKEQILYAADDVRYLRDIYHNFLDQLKKSGRLEWLKNDFDNLSNIKNYKIDENMMWARVKHHNKLQGLQLAILRSLAKWREQQAMKQDKPRKWILSDEILLDIARLMPKNQQAMQQIRGFDARQNDRYGETIFQLIKATEQEPAENWPTIKKRSRLNAEQEILVDTLIVLLRTKSTEHGITMSALAKRKELESIALGKRTSDLFKGWRYEIAGQYIMQWLDGNIEMRIKNEKVIFDIRENSNSDLE